MGDNPDVAELIRYNLDAFRRSFCKCGHDGRRHMMMAGSSAKLCWDYLWCNCEGFTAASPSQAAAA